MTHEITRVALPDENDPKTFHVIQGSADGLRLVKLGQEARVNAQALRIALDICNQELGKAIPALHQEQRRAEAQEREIERLRAGIQSSIVALEEPENTSDTVWFNAHTTLFEHLQFLLDPGPHARGERELALGELA